MPGSWEISPQVLCAILHTETTSVAWALTGIRPLQVPGPVMGVTGLPFDQARNSAAQRALEIGCKWIFFLDSDVTPPPDAILRLMAHNLPIVSGVYHRRSPPVGVPVMQKPAGHWVTTYPANTLMEVDVVGAGCLLIATELLKRMPPQRPGHHWFDWRVHLRGTPGFNDKTCMSEDYTFCLHGKATFGVRTMVDTSVQCGHLGLMDARYGGVQPAYAG